LSSETNKNIMGRKVKALEKYTSEQIKAIIDGDVKHKLGIRIYAVYQSSMGISSRALAKLYNVSFKQIRNWINRFDAEGLQGLLDKTRSGRLLWLRTLYQNIMRLNTC
jgi:hypothetical protein